MKAKQIVYPTPKICEKRPETQCGAYEKRQFGKEIDMNKKICSAEKNPEENEKPVILVQKTAKMTFTMANSKKDEPNFEPQNIDTLEENEEKKEANYLDCEENLKNLEKLKGEIMTKNLDLECEDCMEGLNKVLGMDRYSKTLENKEPNSDELFSQKSRQNIPESMENAPKYVENDTCIMPTYEKPIEIKENSIENDDCDLERIRNLISQTHKDIDSLGIKIPTKNDSPIHEDPTPVPTAPSQEEILKKYENSFTHAKRGIKMSINVSNKENEQQTNCGNSTGIIVSRKITNKTDLCINSVAAPRPLMVTAEMYRANMC